MESVSSAHSPNLGVVAEGIIDSFEDKSVNEVNFEYLENTKLIDLVGKIWYLAKTYLKYRYLYWSKKREVVFLPFLL